MSLSVSTLWHATPIFAMARIASIFTSVEARDALRTMLLTIFCSLREVCGKPETV